MEGPYCLKSPCLCFLEVFVVFVFWVFSRSFAFMAACEFFQDIPHLFTLFFSKKLCIKYFVETLHSFMKRQKQSMLEDTYFHFVSRVFH